MASETSLYEKIKKVLDVAKASKVANIKELHNEIRGQNLTNFLTRRYNEEKDSFVISISDKSIDRVLRLCKLLHLIDQDGHLTQMGRAAIRKGQFDSVITDQACTVLQRAGIELSELNNTIIEKLQSNPPIIPTCREIWSDLGLNIKYTDFSTILTLLAQCGGAESVQKKFYLRIGPSES